jgi:peptidoglycan LD-endopeptidase LytH
MAMPDGGARMNDAHPSVRLTPLLLAFYCTGVLTGWLLRTPPSTTAALPVSAVVNSAAVIAPTKTVPNQREAPPRVDPSRLGPPPGRREAIAELRERRLRMPLDFVDAESFKGGFDQRRTSNGVHQHEAADMLAPRNTPIHAVDSGTIAKIFFNKAGGRTIYQFDRGGRFCYYYAHLERYASGLREGQSVERGDVIGYVGTSGNAPPGTPHLHFAVFVLGPDRQWGKGTAIDPYEIFQ